MRRSYRGQPKQARTLNPHWWGHHDNGGMSRNPQGSRSSEMGCVLFKHQCFNITWLETGKTAKAKARGSWLQFFLFVFSSHLSPNFQLEPRSALPFQHAGKGCGVGKNQATRAGISSPNSKSLELNELCVDRGRLGTFTVSSRRFGGPGCVLKRALLSAGTHDGIGTAPECCRRALQTQC